MYNSKGVESEFGGELSAGTVDAKRIVLGVSLSFGRGTRLNETSLNVRTEESCPSDEIQFYLLLFVRSTLIEIREIKYNRVKLQTARHRLLITSSSSGTRAGSNFIPNLALRCQQLLPLPVCFVWTVAADCQGRPDWPLFVNKNKLRRRNSK